MIFLGCDCDETLPNADDFCPRNQVCTKGGGSSESGKKLENLKKMFFPILRCRVVSVPAGGLRV